MTARRSAIVGLLLCLFCSALAAQPKATATRVVVATERPIENSYLCKACRRQPVLRATPASYDNAK